MDDTTRRKQLASFLRVRRERLTPQQVGLPIDTRRRTKGLRREEVAERAGIGTTWYTWLEQGRDVRASRETLARLGRALELDEEERQHLLFLARGPDGRLAHDSEARISAALKTFIDNQKFSPAYVLNRAWDLLYWNTMSNRVFGDFGQLPERERNIVYHLFLNPKAQRELMDWDVHARRLVAQYRVSCDRFAGDTYVTSRVEELGRKSERFRQLWAEYEVRVNVNGVKTLRHPQVGLLQLHHTSLSPIENPDLRIVTYIAEPASETEAKLRLLALGPEAFD